MLKKILLDTSIKIIYFFLDLIEEIQLYAYIFVEKICRLFKKGEMKGQINYFSFLLVFVLYFLLNFLDLFKDLKIYLLNAVFVSSSAGRHSHNPTKTAGKKLR